MAKFARRQEEANPVFWLATGARKMDPSCPLGISLLVPQENVLFFAI